MLKFKRKNILFIRLYYLENGLQVASKTFDDIEEIYSLEFIDSDEKLFLVGKRGKSKGSDKNKTMLIIWDLYNTGEVEKIEDFSMTKNCLDQLTRASGNILHVDNKGDVTSILKMIESNRQKPEIVDSKVKLIKKYRKSPSDGKIDRKHIIHT